MKALLGIALTMGICSAALAASPATFDIDFKGGTLSEWVDAVRAKAPTGNIVLQPGDSSVRVPSLLLHNVTVDTCVEVVGHIPNAHCHQVGGDEGEHVWVIDANKYRRVQGRGGPVRHATTPEVDETSIIAIPAAYRSPEMVHHVLDAIESISHMEGGAPPKVQVLLDLGLIAVRGTQTQLATCHDIVDMIPVPASSAGQIGRRPDGAERQALLKRLSEISESRRQGIGDPSRLLGEWKAVFEQLKKPQSPKKNDQSS